MISDALNNKIERLQQENSGLYTVEKEKPELNNSILQKIPECPVNIKLYSSKFHQCYC